MTTASPIRLAEALASEGPAALTVEPSLTLVEAVVDAVAVLDANRCFVRGNPAALEVFGDPARPCHLVLYGRPAPCEACPVEGGGAHDAGRSACVALSAGEGRAAAGVVCVLARSNPAPGGKRLAAILEYAVSAVYLVDAGFRIVYVNRAFEQLLGRSRQTLLGRLLADCVSQEAFVRFRRLAHAVMAEGLAREEEIQLALGGRDRIFLAANIPLPGPDGVVDACCGMLTELTAHRHVERELLESRLRYQAIVEDQTELVVRLGPDLRRLFVNAPMARLIGRPMSELVGGLFLEDVPEAEARQLRQRIRDLSPAAPVCEISHGLSVPGQGERRLHWTVRAIFDASGRAHEYQALGRDVTAYWRMERELVKSEAKFRDIFEHSAEGIFQFDAGGTMVACNPALARILGYASSDDVVAEQGDLFRRIQGHQADRLEFLRLLSIQGRLLDFEMQVMRRDGRAVWLSINARAVLDETGRLLRVEGAARDITDRKRAEDERMLLVSAVDQSAEGLVIVSRDFRLEYANPAFSQILGEGPGPWQPGELEGRLEPFLSESVRKMLALGLRWSGRVRLARPDGGETVAEALISPVRDGLGRIVNHIMLVRDMSYELDLERRLRQAEKLEAIGVLAGGVAHDFNNILTPILLNTEMVLADIPWKHPLRKPLSDVVRASERARDLVRQLLTFSRQHELAVGELPLTPLVKETVRLVRGMIDSRLELRQRVAEEPLCVLADPAQMHQVIMNLCLNAAQAMPDGGVLEVGLARAAQAPRPSGASIVAGSSLASLAPGPYARLWVSDTGHGMAPDICERIFEPFFTTKKPGQGTGMGLAAVHGIVKGCGGVVLTTSAVGRGSLFEAYLPLVERARRRV